MVKTQRITFVISFEKRIQKIFGKQTTMDNPQPSDLIILFRRETVI